MNGYHFRLQKLLDIRMNKEEESKRNFKEAQIEKMKVENKINILKENYDKYRDLRKSESIMEKKIRHIYLNTINFNINEASQELKKKEKNLEDKLQDLKQKQIDRKVVETLKENQLEKFLKEENLKEQKINDEFALYGFIRNLERR